MQWLGNPVTGTVLTPDDNMQLCQKWTGLVGKPLISTLTHFGLDLPNYNISQLCHFCKNT